MDTLVVALNTVMPLVLISAVGFILRKLGIINKNFIDASSKIIFNVALPCTIFSSIAGSDLVSILNPNYIIFAALSLVIVALILLIIIPLIYKDRVIAATMIQGMYRSNFVILGIPIATNLFGAEGASVTILLVPVAAAILSLMSVISFAILIPRESGRKGLLVSILKQIATNPLIISSAIGIVVYLLSISLPQILSGSISMLSGMTAPLALLMLGGQFDFSKAKLGIRYSIPSVATRLILLPAIMVTIAVFLGFRGHELGGIFILFASPTAVSSYIMTKQMGGDGDIIGQTILLSTLMSAFSFVGWIVLLKSLSLF